MKRIIPKNDTGICLSGGGALGFAHIGALQALYEHGIEPYHISGASMGAIIGLLYASGYRPEEILGFVEKYKLFTLRHILSISDNVFYSAGLSGHQRIEKLLRELVTAKNFDELPRRFSLSVVDIRNAECKIVSSGSDLVEYVLASMSTPMAFEPVEIGGKLYVDGCIMNNLPVEPLVGPCKRVIGIDVQTAHPTTEKITRGNILSLSYRIMLKQINLQRAMSCHDYISFPELDHLGPEAFGEYKKILDIGYKGMKKYISTHPGIMEQD